MGLVGYLEFEIIANRLNDKRPTGSLWGGNFFVGFVRLLVVFIGVYFFVN